MHNKSISLALLSTGFLLAGSLCKISNHRDDWDVYLLAIGIIIGVMCLMAVYAKER